jgi:5-methylcytosine-specific restriction protein A
MPSKPARYRPSKARPPERRPTAHRRGYTSRWQRASRAFLDQHPLCVRCRAKGLVRGASVVDHVVPHKGDPTLFWDQANWQTLCKRCHDGKTANEDGGLGRPRFPGTKPQ